FMAPSAAGEDEIALCTACGYAANIELAGSQPPPPPSDTGQGEREEVPTPNVRTIADVCALLRVAPSQTLKTLVFMDKAGPVLALVRGDQQLHEKKLARLRQSEVRPAQPDEVQKGLGAPVGSV